MTEHNEKLSYLLDDYRGDNPEATLDEVIGDVNLQYRMRRYQIIGDAMRHELPQAIDTDFHQSVMARIREQAEDSPQMSTQDSTASRLSWLTLRPFAGLAVAASVALVTVALWQPLKQESGQPDDNLVSADQQKIEQLAGQQVKGGAVPVSTRVQALGTRWKLEHEMPGLQQKLNAYLVNHTEYSNSVQGLIPQARVAGFDAQQ
ncbi:MAG: sigma-E factor negative regulatory protein [Gammaproteobacteria bacterium]